jgi:predicted Zn-dependent protease
MLWHLEKRGFDPDVCLAYLALLVDTKNWEDLRALGAKIRLRSNLPETLTAFGYFAEGWAELAQRRTNQAKQAFDKIKAFKIDEPSLAVAMAERLVNAGYVEYAIALLWKLEPQLSNRSVFWLVLTQVAYVQKDNDLLLRAAKRAYELAPDDLIAVNNYAAALLINRVQPEEAIKLTLQLVRQMPMSLVAVVNHATALLLNKRSLEAQELLGQVDAGRLTAEESAQYYRAMFELWLNLDKLAQAREAYQRIDKRLLYRVQVRWLEETLEKLPPPSG